MHLIKMSLGGIPPFTEPIKLAFDEQVNLFIGPNASGKSTILLMLADHLIGPEEDAKRPISQGDTHLRLFLCADDEFDEFLSDDYRRGSASNVLTASEDWLGTKDNPIRNPENPPAIHIGSFREDLPGISSLETPEEYGDTAEDILRGPYSGPRTMCASELLGRELWKTDPNESAPFARVILMDAMQLADACSQLICREVIQDSKSRNYIPNPYALGYLHHPHADPSKIDVHRLMGINTSDSRNFDSLPHQEQPASGAYTGYDDPLPIYLGHLSSGTEGTLLWIRWLALKMVHHYQFDREWMNKPAILLIDEIENHLHPTWQRRVIPALLDHFPNLQIFATTHSPFVVAGLKAGQVHLLNRDENGVVTATTNTEDVIGWTADQILRTMMGVDEPTDQATADRLNRLRQLREKETLTPEEESELNELRRRENADLLSKGDSPLLSENDPLLKAQRERYSDLMQSFLLSRQSDLSQDGA